MNKAIIYGPGDVRVEEFPDPTPGPAEVVIRFLVSSICYTDVKLWNGITQREFPIGFGHDAAGIVEAVGSAVTRFRPGDRVVTEQYLACGTCRACLMDRTDLCPEQPSFYADGLLAGWFTELIRVPESFVIAIPDSVSFDAAATIEPVLTALKVQRVLGYAPGSSVVIVGAGSMGWGQLQVAKRLFGCQVVAIDLLPGRLAMAKQLGADATLDAGEEDVPAAIRRLFGSTGPDVVIETAGSQSGIELAASITGLGGQLALVGAIGTIASGAIIQRGARVYGIRGGGAKTRQGAPSTRHESIDLLANRRIDLEPAISHRFPLSRTADALRFIDEHRAETNKVLLDHSG